MILLVCRTVRAIPVKKGGEGDRKKIRMSHHFNCIWILCDQLTAIRMDGAMATASHSDFICPIEKWDITSLGHEDRKWFVTH